jgi:hypothetical protein
MPLKQTAPPSPNLIKSETALDQTTVPYLLFSWPRSTYTHADVMACLRPLRRASCWRVLAYYWQIPKNLSWWAIEGMDKGNPFLVSSRNAVQCSGCKQYWSTSPNGPYKDWCDPTRPNYIYVSENSTTTLNCMENESQWDELYVYTFRVFRGWDPWNLTCKIMQVFTVTQYI